MKETVSPLFLERYELKYMIPLSLVKPISDFASLYCAPDPHTLASDTGYYRVTTLYLDSPQALFLRMRLEGAENRFNIRVRAYGETPGPPFLEIKQKYGQVIRKYRAGIQDSDWQRAFTHPGCGLAGKDGDSEEARNLRLFERVVFTHQAEPKILTQYLRSAWISRVDAYARVTFDRNLRYMEEEGWELAPREADMRPCDEAGCFDPGCSVILELKCHAASVPLWMIEMIRCFQLQRRSFSKYLNGARALFQSRRGMPGPRNPVREAGWIKEFLC